MESDLRTPEHGHRELSQFLYLYDEPIIATQARDLVLVYWFTYPWAYYLQLESFIRMQPTFKGLSNKSVGHKSHIGQKKCFTPKYREKCIYLVLTRGGHLYFRLDIIRVKGLSEHTLNTYFSGMKIDPKYAFLHAFFFILSVMSFPKFVIWPKTYPFFQFCTFFAPLNDVRAYIAWSWKTTLIMWIFLRGWYPTSNTSGPPRGF